jgi:hypothetical protein
MPTARNHAGAAELTGQRGEVLFAKTSSPEIYG